jgi:hypothetical protein
MNTSNWIVLGSLGAAVLAGCSDDDTTTATTTTTTSTGANGGGGSGGDGGFSEVGGGGSGGATGGGGSGGDGGSTMGASSACQACVADVYENDQACQAAVQACDADTACNDWKNCSETCFAENDTPACYDACDQSFPHDAGLGDPLLACTCDACENVCPATCS